MFFRDSRLRSSLNSLLSHFRRKPLFLFLLITFLITFLITILCFHHSLSPDLSFPADRFSRCPSNIYDLVNLRAFLSLNQSTSSVRPPISCLSKSKVPFLTTYALLSANVADNLPPYLPYIQTALSIPQYHLSYRQSTLSKPRILTIQYSSGFPNDTIFSSHVLSALSTIKPTAVYILTDPAYPSSSRHLELALQNKSYTSAILPVPHQDMLHLIYKASIVFVHRGPLAALAALCVQNKLLYFHDGLNPYIEQNQYKWLLPADAYHVPLSQVSEMTRTLSAMGPVIPSTCKFEAFGHGDGQKIVCANAPAFTTSDCWVMSVGCDGRWDFEKDLVDKTDCRVHTFDCTGDWKVPRRISHKVKLHKFCLGPDDDEARRFMSWKSLIRIGGGEQEKMPTLTKMDIEGHEYPVIASLLANKDEDLFPQQLAVEVHARTRYKIQPPLVWEDESKHFRASPETMAEFFGNLSSKGYQLVHRADNPYCPHCSEVTLVRHDGMPTTR